MSFDYDLYCIVEMNTRFNDNDESIKAQLDIAGMIVIDALVSVFYKYY